MGAVPVKSFGSEKVCVTPCIFYLSPREVVSYRSEGFALTGYDIPGCVDDGAWMLWENSSVVAAVVAVVAHPDLENGQFSSFVTESELPECADRSVSSKRVRPAQFLRKVFVK